MNYRKLGKTGMYVSEIGFGTWAIGAGWGDVSDDDASAALEAAVEGGVSFFDTADAYGNGRSERFLAELKRRRREGLIIATKAGRKLKPHRADKYTPENIRGFVMESLKNLQTDSLDLLQLHCPPTDVYYNPDLFSGLDEMVEEGILKNYGVSVEKVEEAMKAIEFPHVSTVQIIFNIFRQRPRELFFQEAKKRDVGIIIRVPLASGLLTGKMSKDSKFPDDDHRNFNREGVAFDRGETFAGVRFEKGLEAVEELKALVPKGMTMAQFALRWILMFDEVSTVIPGAKRPTQAEDNIKAADFPPFSDALMHKIDDIYAQYVKEDVHLRW